MKSLRRFASLGPDDRALLLNAALLLIAARVCVELHFKRQQESEISRGSVVATDVT